MATSLESLIDSVRIESGLRNNRVISDTKIAGFLTDGLWALRDQMIAKFAYWFRAEYDFTLNGGNDGNSLDLAAKVPDLEMIQGLFLVDSNGNLRRVDLMSSIQETGYLDAAYPFGGDGFSFNGFVGRRYFPDGDKLFVYPAANSAGDYRLIYTPQALRFDFPVTVEFDIAAADVPTVPATGTLAGNGSWLLANANPDAREDIPLDGGFDLTLAFETTNLTFSGTYNAVSFGDTPQGYGQPSFGCTNLTSTAGYLNPASGTGTYTFQPVGTISELPVNLTPWQRYLILYASRIIRQSRRQPLGDIEMQFQQIEKRISALTKQRSEGVRQAPISRGRFGFNGGGME